jgi:polyferredoxin
MAPNIIEHDVYGKKTLCKCPKCGCKHTLRIRWIGRGTPWKFCGMCAQGVDTYEHIEDSGNAPWYAIRRTTALS